MSAVTIEAARTQASAHARLRAAVMLQQAASGYPMSDVVRDLSAPSQYKSMFPFGSLPPEHPILCIIPEAHRLIIDRALVWFALYREAKQLAVLPPAKGTCLELFLLIEQFQVVQNTLREQTANWAETRFFRNLTEKFLLLCPLPPPPPSTDDDAPTTQSKKPRLDDVFDDLPPSPKKKERPSDTFHNAIMLPQDHCPIWNPIHIPTRVFRAFKESIYGACVQEEAAMRWAASAHQERT